MITIAEHTIEERLLPISGNVLDLGCRGFLFADELTRMGHWVCCVDADKLPTGKFYWQLAITHYNGYCEVIPNKDPQGFRIGKKSNHGLKCVTLTTFSNWNNVDFWDLIKIDIEGSEYEVIMSLTEPPAKQLSIEFHLHTGIYGIQDVRKMEAKLHNLGYEFASHEMTSQHGMGMNYWDSLFILK